MLIGALSLLPLCGPTRADVGPWRELLAQADRLSKENKDKESVEAARNALAGAEKDLGPESPEAIHILALLSRFYEKAGDAPRLAELEKRLSEIKSKDFEVWLALGGLLHFQEKSLEAEDALKKALALKSDDFDAERELAIVYQDMGRDDEAVKLFDKAIKQNPQDYLLYIMLAHSDIRLGRSAEAKEAFIQAKAFEGKSIKAYVHEGYFHLSLGESAQARKDFETSIAIDSANPAGYHHLGAYFFVHQQYPEAEKYFRQALEREEANPNTRTDDLLHTIGVLGNVIQLQGRSAEAEAVYRKALDKPTPSNVYVNCLLSLGEIYATQGKSAQAEEIYKRAAETCAEGPACSCRGMSLVGLGDFYLKQGRRREASAMAEEAGKLCSGYQYDPYMLLKFAGLYVSLGDVSKGEAFYNRILAAPWSMTFDSALPSALANLADLDMARGRFHEAEDFYRRTIPIWEKRREWRREAASLNGLAAACEKEGRPQEAAEARERAKALSAQP